MNNWFILGGSSAASESILILQHKCRYAQFFTLAVETIDQVNELVTFHLLYLRFPSKLVSQPCVLADRQSVWWRLVAAPPLFAQGSFSAAHSLPPTPAVGGSSSHTALPEPTLALGSLHSRTFLTLTAWLRWRPKQHLNLTNRTMWDKSCQKHQDSYLNL